LVSANGSSVTSVSSSHMRCRRHFGEFQLATEQPDAAVIHLRDPQGAPCRTANSSGAGIPAPQMKVGTSSQPHFPLA
jgi:hypothetical protein